MHRTIRTIRRLLVAVPVAATLVVAGAGGASAAVVDPGHTGITLDTSISFFQDSLGDAVRITADGTFTTSFIENTTLALQIVGTQTWTDARGQTQTAPLVATPVSIEFASVNHVEAYLHLHPNATVQISYTAEDVGLAPTPFTGSCAGTGVQLSTGNAITTKTC